MPTEKPYIPAEGTNDVKSSTVTADAVSTSRHEEKAPMSRHEEKAPSSPCLLTKEPPVVMRVPGLVQITW